MNTIKLERIRDQIRKCYVAYDPQWTVDGPERINAFKYHLEHTAGIKLDFIPAVESGPPGFIIKQIEILDDPKFTLWLLRWS
jgi:hypothetical protein